MTTTAERQAANVSHNGATYQRTTVAAAEVCAIPAAWVGQYVEFTATTVDVCIRFGAADTVSCDYTTASARDAGTKVLTATTAGPHLVIPAGQSRHEKIDSAWLYFAHISSATTGKLYAVLATGDE
jgi:hypothetical protein